MERKQITFDRFIRGLIACIIIAIAVLLVDRLSGVLLPFFIAWFLAYMMYPLVKFLQFKLHLKSRILCIFLTLILFAGVCIGLVYLIIPPLINEFTRFEKLITYYFQQNSIVNENTIPNELNKFIQRNLDLNTLQKFMSSDTVTNAIKEGVPKLWQFLSSSISYIFSIVASFIILLYLFFILKDYEVMANGWVKLIPEKQKGLITGIVNDVEQGMNQYFRGQAMVSLCIAILFSIGFLIIDLPLAIGLGVLIGILSMVPYLHALGLVPAILLAILKSVNTGQNFWVVLAMVFAVFTVVQILEDAIIVPKIMGKITGLNPAVILLALSIWGSLLGILGMIIALPMTTVMLSYYKRYILKEEIKSDISPD